MIDLYRIAEVERRMAGLIRQGKVLEVDTAAARLRIKDGDFESSWLPWLTGRARDGETTWDAPEVGERIVALFPSGVPAAGVVMPALYCTEHPAGETDPNLTQRTHADGGRISYDRKASTYTIEPPERGEIRLLVGDTEITASSTKVVVLADTVDVTAERVEVTADTVDIASSDIRLGGPGGRPVARVGDKVDPNSHIILEGSNVTKSN